MSSPAPSQLPGAPGSPVYGPPSPDTGGQPDDVLRAWRDLWRAIGHDLPGHVNRTDKIRGGIRRLGLK